MTIQHQICRFLLILFCCSSFSLMADGNSLSLAGAGSKDELSLIAETTEPVTLSGRQTRIVLRPTASAGSTDKTLAERFGALTAGRRIYVVLRNLRATQQPGVLYRLYLDLPADQKTTRTNARHVVGIFNFYNADAADDFQSPDRSQKFFSYDVTDLVRTLRAQNRLSKETTLTIIPTGTPATDAKVSIGRIELVEQ